MTIVLAVYGIGMTGGTLVGGRLADRALMPSLYGGLVAVTVVLGTFGWLAHSKPGALVGVFALGFSASILIPALQTRLMDVAHEGQSLAASLNHSTLNVANALGAWLGSVVLAAGYGYEWPSRVGAALAVAGLVLALVSGRMDRRTARALVSTRSRPLVRAGLVESGYGDNGVERADLVRRRGLRQMRAVALSLLVLAAVVYVVTLHREGGWGYVNAASEAAMVGALADWFAVTALFRRPLGLPIPHTAIVPTRKDSLAESLEQFVTENFLSEEVVAEKMRTAEVSRRAGEWLASGNHAERIVEEGARTIGAALPKLGDEDVTAFVRGSLLPRFAEEPLSPIAGHFLRSVVDDGAHHALFDLLMVEAYDWLRDNRDTLAEVVGPRAPRWSPRWVDSMVIDRIHREALAWLADSTG